MRNTIMTAVIAASIAGCRSAAVESVETPAPEAAPPPATASALPVGTELEVELSQTLSTESTATGERFTATVTEAIVAQNGETAVPQGAVVHGVVTGLDDSDEVGDQAAIRLDFESLMIDEESYPLPAAIVEADVDVDSTRDLEEVAKEAGIGAAAGAALGAIMGGDLSAILGTAILGAGAGTIISLGTGDVEAALPAGSDLTLRTTERISLR